jgi:hypothetical protein
MKRARLIRTALYVASVLAALTLVIGALHMKAARPLLARLGVKCPIQGSAKDIEAARLKSARAQRGTETAASRPALGFALDTMTLADVKAWADKRQVSCEEVRKRSFLRCANVPESTLSGVGAGAGPMITELDFGFAPSSERLVNISAWRSGMTAADAAAQLNAVAQSMKAELGAPTREAGDRSARYLGSGPMRTAMVQYRFSDYIADLSATNIPGRGLMLREHYMSARD